MIYSSISDVGKVRKNNQDNYSNLIRDEFSLFVVADGMGGYQGGEVASKIAVDSILEYITKRQTDKDYENLVERAIAYANDNIIKSSRENPEYESMGTTVVCVLIANNIAYISHLGDSRVYLHRDRKLVQITKDDSYIQSLIDTGIEDIDKEILNKYKNIVTKALGVDKTIEVNSLKIELHQGDYILLTTDGLTNLVNDNEIEEVINMDVDLQEATDILTYMANSSGGFDNITMTLVKI